MLLIITSIILIILLIFTFVWSLKTTPTNLTGYYGTRYLFISIITFIAALVLFGVGVTGGY